MQATSGRAAKLSDTLVGKPVAGGHYLFWTDTRNPKMAIYGYDLNTNQEFVVKQLPLGASSLATDGQILAWVEGSERPAEGDSLHTYNLATKQESTIIPTSRNGNGNELGGVAVDKGTLYYKGSSGLVARDLSSGQEQVISVKGQDPVAADGKLLWVELEQHCTQGTFCPYEWSLHLLVQGGAKSDIVLATSGGENGFSGYHISGSRVVWGYVGGTYLALYDTKDGTRKTIQGKGASLSHPLISGNIVVWSEGPTGAIGEQGGWSIKGYNTDTDSLWTIISNSNAITQAWAIIGQQFIAYTSGSGGASSSLYIGELNR